MMCCQIHGRSERAGAHVRAAQPAAAALAAPASSAQLSQGPLVLRHHPLRCRQPHHAVLC